MNPRVEVVATQLLEQHKLLREPVDVQALAARMGATVVARPLEQGVSGMLIREADRTLLGVNSTHSELRQRFTIAHELAHLALHKGQALYVDRPVRLNLRDRRSSLAIDPEEMEANSFAAALLMPQALVGAAAAQMPVELSSDELSVRLAKRFKVSNQAMTYRLINLGIIEPGSD